MPDTEGLSRWLAARATRRSFLARLGRGAVLVASGSTIAGVLTAQEADARVCGQSGVSPLCPTYDCDDVWGWCWYANGCCADGSLKKICDCCRADHPNVHGYCPSGTNVLCIVESCGADPRVQTVTVRRVPTDDAVAASAGASRVRLGPGAGPSVWLVDAAQALLAAVAAPLAAKAGQQLLLTRGDALTSPLIAELQRLGTTRATLVGAGLVAGLVNDLQRYGIAIERVEPAADANALARVGARELLGAGARRAVCIEPTGLSLAAAPLAAAFAASNGYPLVLSVDEAKALSPQPVLTYLVGPEAARRAHEVPGGHPFHDESWTSLSTALATTALVTEGSEAGRLGLAPRDAIALHALLSIGGPILVHPAGSIEGIRDALFACRDRLRGVALVGENGQLSTRSYYEVQSIVNQFEAHNLIGGDGQGLPVIDQPLPERPVGLARRTAGERVRAESNEYWTSRGRSLLDE